MAFGKIGFLDDRQRRVLFSVSIALIALAFIPFVPSAVSDFLNWQIGTTQFTVGGVLALIALYGAYLISPFNRTL